MKYFGYGSNLDLGDATKLDERWEDVSDKEKWR